MTIAYSYQRFSTPEQLKGDSLRRQLAAAVSYAARNGLTLDESLDYRDLGVSAFRGRNVAEGKLSAFLQAARSGVVAEGSYLLVENLDRISREVARRAFRTLEDIVDAGVIVVTLSDEQKYTKERLDNDPMAFMLSVLTFIRANEESQLKSRRLKAAWEAKRAKAAEGKPLTAKTPAWLLLKDGRYRIIADKARIVQRVFSLTLKGQAPNAIANTFNRTKVPMISRGRRWHRSYVVRILDNPAVIGTLTPQRIAYEGRRRKRVKLEPIPNYFPPVIDKPTWDRVSAMRATDAPLRGRNANAELKNLLGGLARCPLCGGSMTRITKADKAPPRLVCSNARSGVGCSYKSVPYADVENAVIARRKQIARTMPGANERAKKIEAQLETIDVELFAIEERIETLTNQISLKPSKALSRKLEKLEAEHDDLGRTKADLRKSRDLADGAYLKARVKELMTSLGEEPINRQKANARLRQLLSAVVIDYRDGKLDLEWHHGGSSSIQYAWPEEGGARFLHARPSKRQPTKKEKTGR